jgi:hypothetical protein
MCANARVACTDGRRGLVRRVMGRVAAKAVTQTIVAHVRGQALHDAWCSNGKPGTWRNVKRRAKAAVAAKAARDGAQQQQAAPQTAPRGKKAVADRSSRGAAAGKQPEVARQRQPATAKTTYRTSHQKETDDGNKRAWWNAYKAAHKAATTEYAASVAVKKHRQKDFSAAAIAQKYDATLSEDNPHRLTARALTNWVAQKKQPGSSPSVPGPKMDVAKRALLDATITFTQSMQLEGKSQKPSELLAKMVAAVDGTISESLVSSEQRRARLLRDLKKDGRITSGQGESIEARRMEALTEENYSKWFDGWECFLVNRKFGVKLMHPELGKEMVYVSKQKRVRASSFASHVPFALHVRTRVDSIRSLMILEPCLRSTASLIHCMCPASPRSPLTLLLHVCSCGARRHASSSLTRPTR